MNRYESAKELYAQIGVDTDQALKTLASVPISMHCWQGDDIGGFEDNGGASGGIAATGNFPGKARNPEELMADIKMAFSVIPGKHRLNLHALYAIGQPGEKVARNRIEPRHFQPWVDFARAEGIGLDFNSSFFSHPMAADNLTLAHPDPAVREFWVEHGIACRKIADYMGAQLGSSCLHDVWIPDGYKDFPADRMGPRMLLKDSLDKMFAVKYDPAHMRDCVEAKLFGIGVEAFTVGSHEFYMNYVAHNPDVLYLMDSGHFHPTESIADKISALLLFEDRIALHVTRPMRWDSDHVVLLDGDTQEIAREIIRCKALDRVVIGLDFFDASINRIAAWAVGMRNMQKALLSALLMPHDTLKKMQEERRFTEQMALQEELKTYPLGDVWDQFCEMQNVPVRGAWLKEVERYSAVHFPERA